MPGSVDTGLNIGMPVEIVEVSIATSTISGSSISIIKLFVIDSNGSTISNQVSVVVVIVL